VDGPNGADATNATSAADSSDGTNATNATNGTNRTNRTNGNEVTNREATKAAKPITHDNPPDGLAQQQHPAQQQPPTASRNATPRATVPHRHAEPYTMPVRSKESD
jgi:hypothetical protein